MNLDAVRVEILGSKASREKKINKMREHALRVLDSASTKEVILYRQLRCDTEGAHVFLEIDNKMVCKICNWITVHKPD